jgi:hypothetical protein
MNYSKYPFNLFNPENCNADRKEMLQQLPEVPGNFRSLNKTLLHIWDAESICGSG